VLTKLPPLMRTSKTEAFVGSTADILDTTEHRADQAVKQRWPDYALSAALDAIGFERSLPRYNVDTQTGYVARLKRAFSLWQTAGTPLALLRAIAVMGYPNVHLLTARGQDHFLDGSGNLATALGPAQSLIQPGWNHFIVIFQAPLITAWQTTIPGSRSDEANRIRRVIRRWKWGNAAFDGVMINGGGAVWGFPFTQKWGDAGLKWGGSWVTWPAADGITWGQLGLAWGDPTQHWAVPTPTNEE